MFLCLYFFKMKWVVVEMIDLIVVNFLEINIVIFFIVLFFNVIERLYVFDIK